MTNGQIPWDAPAEGQPADQFQPTQPAQTQPFTAATQPDQSQPTVPPLPTPDVPAQPDWAQPAYAQQPQQPAYVQQPPQLQFQADAAQPVYPQPDAGYAQQSYYAQPDPAGVTPQLRHAVRRGRYAHRSAGQLHAVCRQTEDEYACCRWFHLLLPVFPCRSYPVHHREESDQNQRGTRQWSRDCWHHHQRRYDGSLVDIPAGHVQLAQPLV